MKTNLMVDFNDGVLELHVENNENKIEKLDDWFLSIQDSIGDMYVINYNKVNYIQFDKTLNDNFTKWI